MSKFDHTWKHRYYYNELHYRLRKILIKHNIHWEKHLETTKYGGVPYKQTASILISELSQLIPEIKEILKETEELYNSYEN